MEWIPQLFYDILARYLPGVLFMGAFVYLLPEANTWRTTVFDTILSKNPTSGQILLLIGAPYLMGILLSELWEQVITKGFLKKYRDTTRITRLSEAYERYDHVFGHEDSPLLNPPDDKGPLTHMMQIDLKQVADEESIRLLRLRSDCRLCNVLSAGAAILIATYAISYNKDIQIPIMSVLVLILLLSVRRWWRLEIFIADASAVAWLHHFVFKPSKKVTGRKPLLSRIIRALTL